MIRSILDFSALIHVNNTNAILFMTSSQVCGWDLKYGPVAPNSWAYVKKKGQSHWEQIDVVSTIALRLRSDRFRTRLTQDAHPRDSGAGEKYKSIIHNLLKSFSGSLFETYFLSAQDPEGRLVEEIHSGDCCHGYRRFLHLARVRFWYPLLSCSLKWVNGQKRKENWNTWATELNHFSPLNTHRNIKYEIKFVVNRNL